MTKTLPRGLRNNNPGNIRITPDNFQGEINPPQDTAFEQFQTMAHGYRAMFKILYNYRHKHGLKTIRQMISRWAPPEDKNHTEVYISIVADAVGISPDYPIDPLSHADMVKMVAAMSKVENAVPAVMADVEAGWRLFLGK